jgi:phosphomevalonate kinase
MTAPIVARAPGKLFLLGEYAVLDGCPAVIAAVDRYVEARLHLGCGPVRICSRDLAAAVEFPPGAPPAAEGPLRFALAAYGAARRHLPDLDRAGMDIAIASQLDAASGIKAGLGASAAVTTAVAAALFAAAGRDIADPSSRDALLGTALEAHRIAQKGAGSGADVAASIHGGVIRFQSRPGQNPDVTFLRLPPSTRLVAGWSGEAASTPTLIEPYLASANGSRGYRAEFVESVRVAVADFVAALGRGTLCTAAVNENGTALESLGVRLGIPLMTEGLRLLVRIGREHGAGAKISGAGGGDCGIALTRCRSTAERIGAAWREANIVPLDLRVDSKGVTTHHG